MRIVIPSFKRHETINQKSIKTILDSGYPPSQIDLFVANEEQYLCYKNVVHKDINIIIGCLGLKNIRNFIFNYYDEGQKLLCLDDDIECLKILNKDTCSLGSPQLETLIDFRKLVEDSFKLCEENKLRLWGTFTCFNPLFMKNTAAITFDYKFIIGNFFGTINCKNMNKVNISDIDDYERSVRSFLFYGGSLRQNHVSAKTKFLKNAGGAQEDPLRQDTINDSIDTLQKLYPGLLYLKNKKSGIGRSIILKKMV